MTDTPYQRGPRRAQPHPPVEADGFTTIHPKTADPAQDPVAVITLDRTTPVFTDGRGWVASAFDGQAVATGRTAAEALTGLASLIDEDSPTIAAPTATDLDAASAALRAAFDQFQAASRAVAAARRAHTEAVVNDILGQVPHA